MLHNQPLLWTGPRRVCMLFYSSARPARRVAGHRASSVICSEHMRDPVVQCEFDGVTRDGREILIQVAIGELYDLRSDNGNPNPTFYVEVEPLMKRRRSTGTDSFMAMCFGIRLVRQALKVFVAHGGSVYFRGSRSPIDLESYWFESVGGLLRPEFLRGSAEPDDPDE